MGLASALAAQQASQGGAYPPPQQMQYQQQQYPQQQQQYTPAPAAPYPSPYPAQQPAPGAYAGPAAAAATAPPPAGGMAPAGMLSVISARLDQIVRSNEIGGFYPKAKLDALAQNIASRVDFYQLAARQVVHAHAQVQYVV